MTRVLLRNPVFPTSAMRPSMMADVSIRTRPFLCWGRLSLGPRLLLPWEKNFDMSCCLDTRRRAPRLPRARLSKRGATTAGHPSNLPRGAAMKAAAMRPTMKPTRPIRRLALETASMLDSSLFIERLARAGEPTSPTRTPTIVKDRPQGTNPTGPHRSPSRTPNPQPPTPSPEAPTMRTVHSTLSPPLFLTLSQVFTLVSGSLTLLYDALPPADFTVSTVHGPLAKQYVKLSIAQGVLGVKVA